MSSESSDAVSQVQETQATPDPGSQGSEPQKPLMASVGLAILGGIVVWAILQASFPRMKLPRELEVDYRTPPDVREAAKIYQKKMAIVNSTFAMGVFGAVLGGMAALAWLGKQRSKLFGLLAALAAALISGGFGCLAGYAGAAIFEKAHASGTDLELTSNLMMHAAMLSIVGAGAGLVVGALMISNLEGRGRRSGGRDGRRIPGRRGLCDLGGPADPLGENPFDHTRRPAADLSPRADPLDRPDGPADGMDPRRLHPHAKVRRAVILRSALDVQYPVRFRITFREEAKWIEIRTCHITSSPSRRPSGYRCRGGPRCCADCLTPPPSQVRMSPSMV